MHGQHIASSNRSFAVRRSLRCFAHALTLAGALTAMPSYGFDNFVSPNKEELAMTSVPGHPGAPAAILFREEITNDSKKSVQHYERIKVLTEEGKRYANVELQFASMLGDGWAGSSDNLMVDSISGRTIEPDGRVVPFTGKPYLKMLEKGNGLKIQEKVFTLPEVQVGSILEYRYATRYDNYVEPPTWLVQDDLYVKEGHFVWYPTDQELVDSEGNEITTITWFPILPPSAKIDRHDMP